MNDNREQLFWEAQDTINQLKRKIEKLEAVREAANEFIYPFINGGHHVNHYRLRDALKACDTQANKETNDKP